MSQFQEYPKKMSHPQHVAAVWKQLEGKGKGFFAPDTVCTQPERFPEVTVTDLNQEKMYAARGYRPNNMADPDAYELAILETQPHTGYKFQPFPKWKYHAMEIPVIVQNEAEEKALGPGWADAPIIATEDDIVETVGQPPQVQAAPAPAPKAKVRKAKPALGKRRPAHLEAKQAA